MLIEDACCGTFGGGFKFGHSLGHFNRIFNICGGRSTHYLFDNLFAAGN